MPAVTARRKYFDYRQVHCSCTGMSAMTSSTCWPQPAQPIFEQVSQRMGLHMVSPE
jgi:hypothetical protein